MEVETELLPWCALWWTVALRGRELTDGVASALVVGREEGGWGGMGLGAEEQA